MRLEFARQTDAADIAVMSRDTIEVGLGWRWRPARVLHAIQDRETVVLKAEVDFKLVGFAVMRFGWEEAHLDLLAVTPSQRRRGVASAMLHWLEESALTAGTSIVRLEVRKTNYGARRFYQRLGYRRFRTLPNYYGSTEAAVQMARDLWEDATLNSA
jgi:ribosomal-protein-alanine N-acetyltransferase